MKAPKCECDYFDYHDHYVVFCLHDQIFSVIHVYKVILITTLCFFTVGMEMARMTFLGLNLKLMLNTIKNTRNNCSIGILIVSRLGSVIA